MANSLVHYLDYRHVGSDRKVVYIHILQHCIDFRWNGYTVAICEGSRRGGDSVSAALSINWDKEMCEVPCPRCDAVVHSPCRFPKGKERSAHGERADAWRESVRGQEVKR